jgi:hypothetical protein
VALNILNQHHYTTVGAPTLPPTQTLAWTPTDGNALVAILAATAQGLGTSVDTKTTALTQTGVNWVKRINRSFAVTCLQVWVAENVSGADTEIAFSGTALAGNIYFSVLEIEGCPAASYDTQSNGAYLSSNSATRGPGSLTAAQDGELVILTGVDGYENLHTISSYSAGFASIYSATQDSGIDPPGAPPAGEQSVFSIAAKIVSAGALTPEVTYNSTTTSSSTLGAIAIKLNVPGKATDPRPPDGATEVDPAPRMLWTGDSAATSYTLYMGTDAGSLSATASLTSPAYNDADLDYDTQYFWRVDSLWAGGTVTGDVWRLRTVADAWTAEPKTTHTRDVTRYITQFRGKPKLEAYAQSYLAEVQAIEDSLWDVYQVRDIDSATGVHLNILGAIVGRAREGRDDATYRLWIKAQILANVSSGTADEILEIVNILTGNRDATIRDASGAGSGGPAAFYLRIFGTTSADVGEAIASILHQAKPAGVRGDLEHSTSAITGTLVLSAGAGTSTTTGLSYGVLTGLTTL